MDGPLFECAQLLLGFLLLWKGADWLVDGGATLARSWGVGSLIVGLTVVAWGTSMPELVVACLAAGSGESNVTIGTVLGSNVANIGLVLGASGLILPAILHGRIEARESSWLFGSLGLLWYTFADGHVSRVEGGMLVAAFAVHNLILFRAVKSGAGAVEAVQEAEAHSSKRPWLGVVAGSISIMLGAKFVIDGGGGVAMRIGIPETVIALSIYALGTSLPELATSVGSAIKKHADISFGNVIGSNVFNSLAVVGIAALIRPFNSGAEPQVAEAMDGALAVHLPVNLGFALALFAMPLVFSRRFGRLKAFVLIGSYLAYMAWAFTKQ